MERSVGDGDDDGVVLEIVRSLPRRWGVARDPVAAQVDGRTAVGEDPVGKDRVVDRSIEDRHARAAVGRDHVAGHAIRGRILPGPPGTKVQLTMSCVAVFQLVPAVKPT